MKQGAVGTVHKNGCCWRNYNNDGGLQGGVESYGNKLVALEVWLIMNQR